MRADNSLIEFKIRVTSHVRIITSYDIIDYDHFTRLISTQSTKLYYRICVRTYDSCIFP